MIAETWGLPTKAMLWAFAGRYDEDAVAALEEPIEIMTRWEITKTQSRNPDGGPIQYKAIIDTDRLVSPGSVLWQGAEADLPSNPLVPLKARRELYEAMAPDTVPSVEGDLVRYSVTAVRL